MAVSDNLYILVLKALVQCIKESNKKVRIIIIFLYSKTTVFVTSITVSAFSNFVLVENLFFQIDINLNGSNGKMERTCVEAE